MDNVMRGNRKRTEKYREPHGNKAGRKINASTFLRHLPPQIMAPNISAAWGLFPTLQ
jgi:hypothetical protein